MGHPQQDEAEQARPTLTEDESGATALEWTLLLAAIALPSYFIIKVAMATLMGHYQMVTSVNAMPVP